MWVLRGTHVCSLLAVKVTGPSRLLGFLCQPDGAHARAVCTVLGSSAPAGLIAVTVRPSFLSWVHTGHFYGCRLLPWWHRCHWTLLASWGGRTVIHSGVENFGVICDFCVARGKGEVVLVLLDTCGNFLWPSVAVFVVLVPSDIIDKAGREYCCPDSGVNIMVLCDCGLENSGLVWQKCV